VRWSYSFDRRSRSVSPAYLGGTYLMAADDTKRPNCVKVCFSDRAFIDLGRMAAREDRTVADLVHLIVRRHMYGNYVPPAPGEERDSEGL
jgi:hypothetical protein